jgi:ribokinase
VASATVWHDLLPMTQITLIGNITLDVVVDVELEALRQGHQRQAGIRLAPGGGLPNVGARLEELGHRIHPVGVVGDDAAGTAVGELLPWPVGRARGASTEVSVIPVRGERTIVNQQGSARMRQSEVTGRLPANGVTVFAYLNSCGIEVEDVPKLMDDARAQGSTVLCGLAGLFSDDRLAMVRSVLDQCDLLVLNSIEASWLCGTHSLEESCEVLRGMVPRAMVTIGARGVILILEGAIRHYPTEAVRDGRTLGAGDSFLAGVSGAVADGQGWEDACRFGQAAAHRWVAAGG